MSFSLLYSRFAFLLFYVPSNSLSPSLQNLLYCYLPSMLYYTRQYSTLYSTSSTIFFSTIFYSLLPTQCLPLSFSIIFSSLFLSLPPHLSPYTLSSLLLRSIQQYLILLLSFNLPPSLSLSLFFPSLSFSPLHLFLSLSISPFSTLLSLPHSSTLSPRLRRVQQLFGKESGRLGWEKRLTLPWDSVYMPLSNNCSVRTCKFLKLAFNFDDIFLSN